MDEFVVGKKRSGKTKYLIRIIFNLLRKKRFVATNVNLDISRLPLKNLDAPIYDGLLVRLPDVPTASHFFALGLGYDAHTIDETLNGSIILDECSLLFDSYQYMDKELQDRFDYLINSGKRRFNVYYIVHDINTISSRIRRSFSDYITYCYSLNTLLFLQESPLRKYLPNLHVAKSRLAHRGEPVKKSFPRIKFFSASDLQAAYDTEQKYLDAQPVLFPLGDISSKRLLSVRGASEFLLFSDTRDKKAKPAPEGFAYIDLRAPYTVLPSRLSCDVSKLSKENKKKQITSLFYMLSFLGLIFYMYFSLGQDEENKEPDPVAAVEEVQTAADEPKEKVCNFIASLDYVPKNTTFSDDWLIQLMKSFKPVVRDYNYLRPYLSTSRLDYNLLFYDSAGQYLASTNPTELAHYGWHSFPWSRGLALLQKTYWLDEGRARDILNRREVYIFLLTDAPPPSFSQSVSANGQDSAFDGIVSAVSSSVLK